MTEHVSDLTWDRLLAGDAAPDAEEVAYRHAATCALCGTRLRELTAERNAFRTRPVPRSFAAARRPLWRWALPLAPALIAAVVLAIVRPRAEAPDERAKGTGPVLILAAGQPGALVPLGAGDAIRAGEHLQAGYTAARAGFGAVLARDGAGTVAAYVPARGDAMVPLPAGADLSFPQSTILDGVTGRERIAIAWCETAHPLAPLLAALRAGAPLVAPAGCTIRELVLEKTP